jgi:hypothetical protein
LATFFLNFSKSPEDLATEALCYILGKSAIANTAMLRFLQQVNPKLPETLVFTSQKVGDERERPDIIGKDVQGAEIFLGEAKFWAGLTDNQPLAYLERLKGKTGSILLFISPQKRLGTLWPEIIRRCQDANLNYMAQPKLSNFLEIAKCDQFPIVALASWRAILNIIQSALEAEDEIEILSDVSQLRGLCDRMDEEAFLPLQSHELASNGGTWIVQYCDLVYDLTERLIQKKLVENQKLNTAGAHARYGRYFLAGVYGCMIQFNVHWWSKIRGTPLWLSIKNGSTSPWSFPDEAQNKLIDLEMEEPSLLIKHENALIIPLYLPIGEERDFAMDNVLTQLREVF